MAQRVCFLAPESLFAQLPPTLHRNDKQRSTASGSISTSSTAPRTSSSCRSPPMTLLPLPPAPTPRFAVCASRLSTFAFVVPFLLTSAISLLLGPRKKKGFLQFSHLSLNLHLSNSLTSMLSGGRHLCRPRHWAHHRFQSHREQQPDRRPRRLQVSRPDNREHEQVRWRVERVA